MKLVGMITEALLKSADQVAIIEGGKSYSFRMIEQRASKLASKLFSLGIKKGDKVAVLLKNCLEYHEVYLAGLQYGIVVV